MKSILASLAILLMFCFQCSAGNLVQSPTADSDNTITSPNGVIGLTSNSTDKDAIHGNAVNGAGAAFYSENSYGIVAQSLNGTPLWVGQNATQDTEPAMVIQSIDVVNSEADLLSIQDENGTPLLSVNPKGDLQFAPHGSKPTCDSDAEGLLHYTKGNGGTAAKLETCDWNGSAWAWVAH